VSDNASDRLLKTFLVSHRKIGGVGKNLCSCVEPYIAVASYTTEKVRDKRHLIMVY